MSKRIRCQTPMRSPGRETFNCGKPAVGIIGIWQRRQGVTMMRLIDRRICQECIDAIQVDVTTSVALAAYGPHDPYLVHPSWWRVRDIVTWRSIT